MLRAPVTISEGLADYAARDGFNQSAGALAGKTAALGGTWSGAGDSDDFTVDATNHRAFREVSSADATPRFERLGTGTLASVVVQADVTASQVLGNQPGVMARYTNTTNYLHAYFSYSSASLRLFVAKVVGGSGEFLVSSLAVASGNFTGIYRTLRLHVDPAGRWFVWVFTPGSTPGLVASGADSDLATGGALASGGYGLVSEKPAGASPARADFANFAAWPPTADAVIHPNQSAELRTEGFLREDASGTAWGPVSDPSGSDLPRIPVSGLEGRPVELFLLTSRGDLRELPDDGIDDKSVKVYYRPSYLFPQS